MESFCGSHSQHKSIGVPSKSSLFEKDLRLLDVHQSIMIRAKISWIAFLVIAEMWTVSAFNHPCSTPSSVASTSRHRTLPSQSSSSSSSSSFYVTQQPSQNDRSFFYLSIPMSSSRSSSVRFSQSTGDEEAENSVSAFRNSTSSALVTKETQEDLRKTLLRLAEWSLEDYKWRSSVFKEAEADRMVEETLARVQGTKPTYVRPMDAGEEQIGPLGQLEKSAVEWLSQVIDEEGRRAKKIIDTDGRLVRPIDSDELGPLGKLEQKVVEFLRSITSSERERVRTKTLRPMDLEESIRGPLGRLEEAVSKFFADLRESERMRYEFSKNRGGAMVRPIDVPGPLGELELWIGEILKAEELRAMEKKSGTIVRPMEAKVPGPLGKVEKKAYDFLDRLSAEEMERLRNMKQYLKDARPMESNRDSLLGIVETIAVGIIRAPLLVLNVIDRVRELIESEPLEEIDQQKMESKNLDPPNADTSSPSTHDDDFPSGSRP